MPGAQGFGRAVDCRQALFGIAALEGDEARQVEPAHEDRQLAQFGLVQNPQPRKSSCSASKRMGGSTLLAWLTA